MKKLLSVLSILAVLVALVSAGLFGYAKYKEVESKQQKLETQLDNKKEESSNSEDSSNSENTSNNNEQVSTNTQTKDTNEESENNQQVTRDNVFDYLFAGLEEIYGEDGFDKDLITFQNPVQDENGDWDILANNKSGHGSYNFKVTSDGLVQNIDNAGGRVESTRVNLN